MNILFDVNHPAHVHLFKNFIFYLKRQGHTVVVMSRTKDVTTALLDHYNIAHIPVTSPSKGLLPMLKELIIRDLAAFKLFRNYKFPVAFGTSAPIAHLSIVTNLISCNFNEDDDDVVPINTWSIYPFTSKIVVPSCLSYKHWQKKRVIHNSYHELAYLHPHNFSPDEKILDKYGLKKKQYIIFRFSALKAHHDVGAKGISTELKGKMMEQLKGYDIIESMEGKAGNRVEPWDMHHLLAFAKMIISDSQTMTIEGSVLGIPAIRINTFIGKSTVIDELEQKYKLAFGFHPDKEREVLTTLACLINNSNLEADWQDKKNKLLKDKTDFNQWMIDFFEKEIVPLHGSNS